MHCPFYVALVMSHILYIWKFTVAMRALVEDIILKHRIALYKIVCP